MFGSILNNLRSYISNNLDISQDIVFLSGIPDNPDNALSLIITGWKRTKKLSLNISLTVLYREKISQIYSDFDNISAFYDKSNNICELLLAIGGVQSLNTMQSGLLQDGECEPYFDANGRIYTKMRFSITVIEPELETGDVLFGSGDLSE